MKVNYSLCYGLIIIVEIIVLIILFLNNTTNNVLAYLFPFLFFVLLSPLIHWLGTNAGKQQNANVFITKFYTAFIIKFFAAVAFIVLYLIFLKNNYSVKWMAASFIVNYIMFSVVETYFLLKTKPA